MRLRRPCCRCCAPGCCRGQVGMHPAASRCNTPAPQSMPSCRHGALQQDIMLAGAVRGTTVQPACSWGCGVCSAAQRRQLIPSFVSTDAALAGSILHSCQLPGWRSRSLLLVPLLARRFTCGAALQCW